MRLSKIKAVVKRHGVCALVDVEPRGDENAANLYRQWIGSRGGMYPVDAGVYLDAQAASTLMELNGDDIRFEQGSTAGEDPMGKALLYASVRIDGSALRDQRIVELACGGETYTLAKLEDGSTAYMQSYLLEPCRRKWERLRMIRQGDAVAVYAGDDLTGVVGCLPTGDVEELRTYLKEII